MSDQTLPTPDRDVGATIKAILSEITDVPIGEIPDSPGLPNHLEMDSLQILELMVELETTFQIEIEESDVFEMIDSVRNITSYVSTRLAASEMSEGS